MASASNLSASSGDLHDLDAVAFIEGAVLELPREQGALVQLHNHGFRSEAEVFEQAADREWRGDIVRAAVEDEIHGHGDFDDTA